MLIRVIRGTIWEIVRVDGQFGCCDLLELWWGGRNWEKPANHAKGRESEQDEQESDSAGQNREMDGHRRNPRSSIVLLGCGRSPRQVQLWPNRFYNSNAIKGGQPQMHTDKPCDGWARNPLTRLNMAISVPGSVFRPHKEVKRLWNRMKH